MPILHLGVADIPYNQAPAKRKAHKVRPGVHKAPPARPAKANPATVTTGDVAEWLENRYHVMEHFFEMHQADIATALENSAAGAFESLLMGSRTPPGAFAAAEAEIEAMFLAFLSNREMDGLGYPGVPTAAAERGVSHRFKRPYVRRASRPSFIDTGLYQSSFKSWMTE